MQCTEAGVVVALRRSVERMHTLPERKESCLKLAWTMASSVVTEQMCCRSCVSNAETAQLDAWERQLLTGRVRPQVFEKIEESLRPLCLVEDLNDDEVTELCILSNELNACEIHSNTQSVEVRVMCDEARTT